VGVVCNQGSLPTDKPAPSISGQFSAGIEKVLLHNGVEQTRVGLQLYMDNSSQLLRMDLDQPIENAGRPSHGRRPTTYINDYKHGNNECFYCHNQVLKFIICGDILLPDSQYFLVHWRICSLTFSLLTQCRTIWQ
jgi:hypothetical protein